MKKLLTMLTLLSAIISSQALAGDANPNTIVSKLNQEWNAAFNASDSAALAKLYAKEATLSPGNGKVLKGQKAIAALFQSFMDNGVKNHQIEIIETHQARHQIVQLAHWKAEGMNDKQEKITFGGVLLSVIEKSHGEWKTVSHVWNAAP